MKKPRSLDQRPWRVTYFEPRAVIVTATTGRSHKSLSEKAARITERLGREIYVVWLSTSFSKSLSSPSLNHRKITHAEFRKIFPEMPVPETKIEATFFPYVIRFTTGHIIETFLTIEPVK